MKAKKLIKAMQKIVDKHGDMEVMFDTEAQCFNVHLVNVDSADHLSEKDGMSRNMVCLGNSEPHRSCRGGRRPCPTCGNPCICGVLT